jgi:hypothetical protein
MKPIFLLILLILAFYLPCTAQLDASGIDTSKWEIRNAGASIDRAPDPAADPTPATTSPLTLDDLRALKNEQNDIIASLNKLGRWHTVWGSIGLASGVLSILFGAFDNQLPAGGRWIMVGGGVFGISIGVWEIKIGKSLMINKQEHEN